MAYLFYLDKLLLPVTPSKLQIKTGNNNSTLNLISGGEINVLKAPGLKEMSFDALLPNVSYPFSRYDSGFRRAEYFLAQIRALKETKQPFQFIVTRELPSGIGLSNSNIKATIEDYTENEDAKNGFDIVVSLKLKEYKDYSCKTVNVTTATETSQVTAIGIETVRETVNSPEPATTQTHTVQSGDTLWAIAKRYYGDGSKYTDVFDANSSLLTSPSKIYPGQVLVIPVL